MEVYSLDRSFVSWLGVQFTSVVMTGVAVGAGGSGAKSMYASGITTFPFCMQICMYTHMKIENESCSGGGGGEGRGRVCRKI